MTFRPISVYKMLSIVTLLIISLSIASPAYGSTDSDKAREDAKKILASKKYGRDEKQPFSKGAKRITQWLGEGKNKGEIKRKNIKPKPFKLPNLFPGGSGLSLIGWIILALAITLVIGLIIFVLYKVIKNREAKEEDEDKEKVDIKDIDWSDEEKVMEEITDSELLFRLSDQAEAAGQLDIALRYRFRAGLLRLSDMKIISFHPSVTNAKWQLVINNNNFDLLTRDFNDITYGEIECDQQHLSRSKQMWPELFSKAKK
ncbi:MAG: hypothetical protein U0R17_04555 [Acidimicrobiia bacterium]